MGGLLVPKLHVSGTAKDMSQYGIVLLVTLCINQPIINDQQACKHLVATTKYDHLQNAY